MRGNDVGVEVIGMSLLLQVDYLQSMRLEGWQNVVTCI